MVLKRMSWPTLCGFLCLMAISPASAQYAMVADVIDGGGGGVTPDYAPTIAHYGDGIVLFDSLNYYYQSNVGEDETTNPTDPNPPPIWSGYVAQDLEGDDFSEPVASLGSYHIGLVLSPSQAAQGDICQLIVSGSADTGTIVGGVTMQMKLDGSLIPLQDKNGEVSISSASNYNVSANAFSDSSGTAYLLIGIVEINDGGLSSGEWARIPLQVATSAKMGDVLTITGISASATDVTAQSETAIDLSGLSASVILGTAFAGDINGDGKVNIQDATLALRIAVGLLTPTSNQKIVCDVNDDGKCNIQDTVLILQVATGVKSSF